MKRAALLSLTLLVSTALAAPASAQADDAHFSDAELDQMLAPIALYPDTVLTHVLIASTYPLEVVQAARWSREHPGLKGAAAVAEVEDRPWDASVKALVAFPELLARLDEDLEWTQRLGEAFLAQEGHVMDRVQALRVRAYDAGHLDSLEHARVIREREVIYIEPAVTEVVYVPYYDTRVIYGHWWWPAYPPVYWGYPYGYSVVHFGGPVFYWGFGYRVWPSFYYCSFNWPRRQVVVVNTHHHHYYHSNWSHARVRSGRDAARHADAKPWHHQPEHRRGVAYRNDQLNREHGRPHRSTAEWRARNRGGEHARPEAPSERRAPSSAAPPDRNPVPANSRGRSAERRSRPPSQPLPQLHRPDPDSAAPTPAPQARGHRRETPPAASAADDRAPRGKSHGQDREERRGWGSRRD